MSRGSKETAQLYTVVVLSIVAAIMAYFRFFHRSATVAPGAPEPTTIAVAYEVPTVPDWGRAPVVVEIAKPVAYRPPPRDIFAPVIAPPEPEHVPAAGPQRKPTVAKLRLSGTMNGAQGALASINGEMLGVGDRIRDYTVAMIHPRQVVLVSGSRRLVLNVGE